MHIANGAFGGILDFSMETIRFSKDHINTLVNWCVLKRLNQGARKKLDFARNIPFPDDLLIDDPSKSVTFTVSNGNIYRFWIMSVGILTSINFGIQGHMITLVEVEGSHTLEEVYESLDIHIGQSLTVLKNEDQWEHPVHSVPDVLGGNWLASPLFKTIENIPTRGLCILGTFDFAHHEFVFHVFKTGSEAKPEIFWVTVQYDKSILNIKYYKYKLVSCLYGWFIDFDSISGFYWFNKFEI
uniref:Plastocyanin-like domain-containing protein n=1 Tax=Brassica oleracea TaxID=3712 RepID=A0A3P6GHY7_BRAOL|nr:unnamed protein product [Brassica oleracea]